MITCPKCGHHVPSDKTFCAYCGRGLKWNSWFIRIKTDIVTSVMRIFSKTQKVKADFFGTAILILVAIFIIVAAVFDLPESVVVWAIPAMIVGFGLQLVALYQARPRPPR